MQHILIKKKKYAIGLWWQFINGSGKRKDALEQARILAEKFPEGGYNCVAIRKQQFGLGNCAEAKIKRLPSLACALVERSQPTWIGMFCLSEELWWVCAVSKKNIAAEGDQYFNSQAEAEAHFKNLKSLSDWDDNEILCETVEESMDHFNGLLRTSEKVQPLVEENRRGLLISCAALCAALSMGWLIWDQFQQDQLAELRRLAAIESNLKQQEIVPVVINPDTLFAKTWNETALPSAFAYEFLRAVRHTEPYTLGWKLKSVIRNNEGIYMAWLHQQGAQFTDRPGNSTLGSSPELAEIAIPYSLRNQRAKQELGHKSEVTARLYELTRVLGAKLRLNWKNPEIKKLDKTNQHTAPWIKGGWKLSALPSISVISEPLFFELDTIPGLVLTKIDLTENKCTMEGQIYASY
ncbi:type 4b pilus protein PilO2 [Desulfovibrio sp. JC010]|uniref:type 4b pilus protein PilO2 n=1 Tax=Desulfovibrio sp. JC010 TaxID=2593641 RepID=UPI0013D5C281|nr:type 4b pilus protein PilO2 [Desulfovibrio sp. JC010]NDV28947.1 hypothetical protein [Desulfovibrio sp. JC010]